MRHDPPFLRMIASRLGIAKQSVAQKTMPALRRVPSILAHYRDTRKLLRGSISKESRRGLDWLNFFLADVQTGFGAFVAFYLAELGWSKAQVGLALAAGTIAALIAQIPGGALVDAAPWKRGLAGIGICMIGASALIFAVAPAYVLVFVAQILNGVSGAIVTPAIAAISLGLVGRGAMSTRTGRNTRFNALGNVLTAGAMGLAGQYVAKSAIFFGAAVLCAPALIALVRIRGDEIDYARARNAGIGKQAGNIHRIFDIGKNAKLYIFAGCLFMFQFADASMLPVIGQEVARNQNGPSAVLMAGLIAVPQVITALISPWVGYHSERFGRNFSGSVVCMLLELLDLSCSTASQRRQRCGRNRADDPCDHRSNNRYRSFQLSTRFRRHCNRYCGFYQHRHNRLHFPRSGKLAGISDFGGFCHCGCRTLVVCDAGNTAD
jgi:MFS family permease